MPKQKLHDPILQDDFERINQLLDIASDYDDTSDLYNEATQIRRRLASDTSAPDWLRGAAQHACDELRPACEGHPAGPYDPMGETVYCDGSCRR